MSIYVHILFYTLDIPVVTCPVDMECKIHRKLHLNAESPLALSKLNKYVLSWFSILPLNPKVHSNQIVLDVLPGFGLDTAHSVLLLWDRVYVPCLPVTSSMAFKGLSDTFKVLKVVSPYLFFGYPRA